MKENNESYFFYFLILPIFSFFRATEIFSIYTVSIKPRNSYSYTYLIKKVFLSKVEF